MGVVNPLVGRNIGMIKCENFLYINKIIVV